MAQRRYRQIESWLVRRFCWIEKRSGDRGALFGRHGTQPQRDLEDLFEIVGGCCRDTDLVIEIGFFADIDQTRSLVKTPRDPAWIDRGDTDEQRKREEQMHQLQHLDHALSGTSIEVVDVQHDPTHRRRPDDLSVDDLFSDVVLVRLRHQIGELFEVVTNPREDRQLLQIAIVRDAIVQELFEKRSGRQLRKLGFLAFDHGSCLCVLRERNGALLLERLKRETRGRRCLLELL